MDDTRQAILSSATVLFAERGYDGASVREIVKAAGVNVSLISYHFGGKKGLYRECLVAAGRARLEIAETTLTTPTSVLDVRRKLERFVERSIAALAFDLDAQRLVAGALDRPSEGFQEFVEEVFYKVHEVTARFFAEAQQLGHVRRDLVPAQLASMLRGLLVNEARLERVKNRLLDLSIKDEAHRLECVRHIAGVFLDGIF